MTAKRVSSAKKAKEKAAAEQRLCMARTLLENLVWACEHNPDDVRKTTVEHWHAIFERLREAIR